MQVQRDIFREEKLKEPSPRKQMKVLPSQLARIPKVRLTAEELMAIERALVEHAKRQAGEVK
ncbi:hypothetical protein [Desulfurococcus sp.]|uniref:hypothetical protein n=1 Tax=Desulfurococcus sp. TaxID=51678 RepID=UPI003172D47D